MTAPRTTLAPPPRAALSRWASLRARFAARVSAWHQRLALRAEIDAVDVDDLREILHDLNIDASALPTLVDPSGRSRVLLPAMLHRVGLDGPAIEARHPAVANDLRRVCAGCTVKGPCRRALEAGDSALRCLAFCPNAQTLDALRREMRTAA
ncbi:hypothetical protein ACM64Y_11430 [Novispirillum sp. DQ9]|uniref:hypothetical protein n=1 Tax=Novispirillum sp. DQ9 TaxID=3398612 RepID=UPI003C7975BD